MNKFFLIPILVGGVLAAGIALSQERYPGGERYPDQPSGGYISGSGVAQGDVTVPDGSCFITQSNTRIDGGSTVGDGNFLFENSAGTQGVLLNSTDVDGVCKVEDETGAAASVRGSLVYVGTSTERVGLLGSQIGLIGRDGAQCYMSNDTATDGAAMLLVTSSASAEMTASSGTQYSGYFDPEIAQTGTGAFVVLGGDVEDTSSGSGQDYIFKFAWATVEQISVTDTGNLDLAGEADIGGISGDGAGSAVCIKADGDLGTCTDAVGAGGTCTCS